MSSQRYFWAQKCHLKGTFGLLIPDLRAPKCHLKGTFESTKMSSQRYFWWFEGSKNRGLEVQNMSFQRYFWEHQNVISKVLLMIWGLQNPEYYITKSHQNMPSRGPILSTKMSSQRYFWTSNPRFESTKMSSQRYFWEHQNVISKVLWEHQNVISKVLLMIWGLQKSGIRSAKYVISKVLLMIWGLQNPG